MNMKLKDKVRYTFVMLLTVVFSLGVISASALAAEFDVYGKIESFTWKEYNDNGSQLLKESGPIYGLGFSNKSDIAKSLTFKVKGELFGGSIDYDGQTQAGTPAKTDTNYFGMKVEGDLGWKFMVAKKSSLEPFAGLGWRWWLRDIKSTGTAIGYEELWSSVYARLGLRGDYTLSEQVKAFAEGGVKLPIYTENKIDIYGVTVKPGNEASAFAEAGFKWAKLKVNVFYEGMRFSKSDPVTGIGVIVWQPKSKADIYGVNLGVSF